MNMNKEEFIKKATEKVYNFNQKQKIKAELTDHIETKECYFREIGYSKEASEEKALCAMGDAEEISQSLSKLYNSFYNPAPDIIAFAVWFSVLGVLYLFFRKYIFGDIGTTALCAGAIALTTAILLTYTCIGLIKKSKPIIIGNIIGSIINAAFNLFCMVSIDKTTGGSSSAFNAQVFGSLIPAAQQNGYHFSSLIITIILFILSVSIQILILFCIIKTEKAQNSKRTNSTLKILKAVISSFAAASIIAAAVFTARFFAFQSNIKNDYIKTYQLAIEISEQCETWQQVSDYVSESGYDFKATVKDGIPQSYKLDSSTACLLLTINADEDDARLKELDKFTGRIFKMLMAQYPETLESKYQYSVQVSTNNISKYKNGADSISLMKLKTNEEYIDKLYNIESETPSKTEIIHFVKESCPSNAYILPSKDKRNYNSEIKITYTCGYGENAYDTEFDFICKSEKAEKIDEIKSNIISTIKSNPDITKEALAKAANAEITTPEVSYTEYLKYIEFIKDSIESNEESAQLLAENDIDLKTEAENFYKFLYSFKISNDLMFNMLPREFSDNGNAVLLFFNSKTNIEFVGFEIIDLSDQEENKYNAVYLGNFRKVNADEKYFSMKGYAYSDYENVPYYTKNGIRYRFVIEENENGNERYFLKNIHGDKHEADFCYTDKDGFLVFDDDKTFFGASVGGYKTTEYHDKKGNKYTKALETNWDSNGELLNFNEYLK